MRLRERDKRDVWVHSPQGMRDDVYLWGEGTAIRAAVYPVGVSLEAKVYGERVKEMRLMLYDGSVELRVGMGVSLTGGEAAYRIASLEDWAHQRAVLERIAEGRRGDGEGGQA